MDRSVVSSSSSTTKSSKRGLFRFSPRNSKNKLEVQTFASEEAASVSVDSSSSSSSSSGSNDEEQQGNDEKSQVQQQQQQWQDDSSVLSDDLEVLLEQDLAASTSENEDPVELMLQLRRLRKARTHLLKGMGKVTKGVKRGTHKVVKTTGKASHKMVKQTGKASHSIVKSTGKASQKMVKSTGKASNMVVKKTAQTIEGTHKQLGKGTQMMVQGASNALSAISPRSSLYKQQQHDDDTKNNQVEYDEEAGVTVEMTQPPPPTESQPLLLSTKEKQQSRGASLWDRIKDRKDSIVFRYSQLQEDAQNKDEDAATRKSRLSQVITDEIRSGLEFSLKHCLMAIGIYLVLAVVAYSFLFEQWSIVDSLYFACVTFTTIGYGDLVPTSDASRLFTAMFALSGVASLGIALGVLGSNLIDAQVKAVDRARELSRYQVMSIFDSSTTNTENLQEEAAKMNTDKSKSLPWYQSHLVMQVLPMFSLLFVSCWYLGAASDWTFVSTLYFCIISASTVGFGDLTPTTQSARLFCVLFIPVAVGAMGHWLSMIGNFIIERRQAEFQKKFQARELTLQDLEVMDDNGDGQVTRAEYLEFMLVAMNKVDPGLLKDLTAQFNRLDVDGTGILEKQDLVIVAKRKLKSPKRKLQLSQYKQELLSAGKDEQQPAFGIMNALSSIRAIGAD